MSEREHPHLAVMFTDIKGYSLMMSEDESAALRMLLEHNQIMESVIDAHGGRVVKKLGDSYMVIFDGADAAVKCGLHALTKIAARNRRGDKAVEIRVGIHEGSMRERGNDFFGESVNIAARLEQMGKPMTITASERVVQTVATRVKCEARFVGAEALKNLRYPVSVYRLTPADSWKLYLTTDGAVAGDEHDVLCDYTDAESVWQDLQALVESGDLNAAAGLAAAALSRFGGRYADYCHLAALHLIGGHPGEAQTTLKMGEMLGQEGPDDAALEWLTTLANLPEGAWNADDDEVARCLAQATAYAAGHAGDLVKTLLCERLRARISGQVDGLARMAQQHPDKALLVRGYAEALKDLDRRADAHRMLEKAIAVAPAVADHQLRRVQWMVDEDDLESVLAESQALAGRFPDEPRVYEWTGKTRLLNLDPHGAQWVFEQRAETDSDVGSGDLARWHICSMMHQGRFDRAMEAARRSLRSAIRKNLRSAARRYLPLAAGGMYLDHWDGALEILEEYKRYDPDWLFVQAALIAAKVQRQLMPWDRAIAQLGETAERWTTAEYPHPSAVTALALLPVARDVEWWSRLHELEFLRSHRNWIVERGHLEAALQEARGALQLDALDPWHGQLVPILTRLSSRLHDRLPSLLAIAGLIQVRLDQTEAGNALLQQARKLWAGADWPVWEIQEAESALAGGPSSQVQS